MQARRHITHSDDRKPVPAVAPTHPRPLLECEGTETAGFDTDFIAGWIGLAGDHPPVGEGCPRPDMPPCPSRP